MTLLRVAASALTLLLVTAAGALAQGRACVDAPTSDACSTCRETFTAPEMTSLMCFDGGPVTSDPASASVGFSCSFDVCPETFSDYEQCIGQGRELANSAEVEALEDAVSGLIEGPRERLCDPDVRDPIMADVKALADRFRDFTLATGQAMRTCLYADIANEEAFIETERAEPIAQSSDRLRDARIRRAQDRIKSLHDLHGRSVSIGYSEVGQALADLGALSDELPSLCN